MKVFIFGTGEYYQRYKKDFLDDIYIVGFLDNNKEKQGIFVDGIEVFAPEEVLEKECDFVFLMSGFYLQMKKQLLELGVDEEKIVDINELNRICKSESIADIQLPNNENKNVLILSPAFTFSGAQNAMLKAANAMQKSGLNIVICSSVDGILREKINQIGMQAILIRDMNRSNPKFEQICEWADVIWANTVWMYFQVCDLVSWNKKVVWWLHESGVLKYITNRYWDVICNSTNLEVYSVSPIVKDLFVQKTNGKREVFELLYGLEEYKGGHNSGKIVDEPIIYAVIGDISPEKAQDIYIKAVDSLPKEKKENAEFWIIGRGRLKDEWIPIVEANQNIHFIGEVDNNRMPEIYSKIDIVISSSREDAMPIVVTEALMNKKFVIISDAIGTNKYIKHKENGLVFKSEDINDLADKISWSMEHVEACVNMAEKGYEIYKNYFTMESFEKNIVEIILS